MHTHTALQGTDKKFAMKTLDKLEMQERNKVQRVLTEELILTSVDHPFLPTLYCTIQVCTAFSCTAHSCTIQVCTAYSCTAH